VYGELDEQRGGINHLGRLLFTQTQKIDAVDKKIEAIYTLVSAAVTPSANTRLPPMHDRRESYLDMIEQISEEGLHKLRKRASETPGPGVGDAPEEVMSVFREMMEKFAKEREERDRVRAEQAELLALRTENEARIENERITRQTAVLTRLKALADAAATKELRDAARAAIDEAARKGEIGGPTVAAANLHFEKAIKRMEAAAAKLKTDRRNLVLKIIVPLLISFLGWLASQAYARAERAAGLAEGKASGPPVLVLPPPVVSTATATAVGLPPPEVPAVVTPRRHP
jgi:hypothetical protein